MTIAPLRTKRHWRLHPAWRIATNCATTTCGAHFKLGHMPCPMPYRLEIFSSKSMRSSSESDLAQHHLSRTATGVGDIPKEHRIAAAQRATLRTMACDCDSSSTSQCASRRIRPDVPTPFARLSVSASATKKCRSRDHQKIFPRLEISCQKTLRDGATDGQSVMRHAAEFN